MADITSVDLARGSGRVTEARGPGPAAGDASDVCRGTDGRRGRCGGQGAYGQSSEDWVNYRNGYQERRCDVRAGPIDLRSPAAAGQLLHFPDWPLERRRRSEQALVS
jgi:hypothetical protein